MRLALFSMLVVAAAPPPQPHGFDIEAFFTGRTHADNDLKIVFQAPHKLIVDSVGHREGNQFVQIDTVREEGKPVRTRKWVTHQLAPGHFTGTLSDATGPVDITVSGDTATIRYTMTGGLSILQQMQQQPGGRALSNHVDARKFGLKFATVNGTISKLD
jgi:Protein of unknown function (DUF3833)